MSVSFITVLDRIGKALKELLRKGSIGRKEFEEFMKEVKRALLLADVDIKLVKEISRRIEERVFSEEKPKGVTTKQWLAKVVYEELVKLLGKGESIRIRKPLKIMLIGLYGSGKTTTAAKLGFWLKKHGLNPTLVSLDRERPAAFDQLKQLAESIGLKASREVEGDVAVIDTAGRNALSEEMVKEIKELVKEIEPDEVLLVIPAEMGRHAKEQAEAFREIITGVVITRFDGTAKGGGALAACAVADVPVKFLGVGEKVSDLEPFEPTRFVSRLLGWGDLKTLLEKVREAEISVKPKEIFEEFNMLTFYKQLEAMAKIGPVEKILQLMGLTELKKEEVEELKRKMKVYKAIIDSMTKQERLKPEIINRSRMERIAKGSGTSIEDVRALLNEYFMAKKFLKQVKRNRRLRSMVMKKWA